MTKQTKWHVRPAKIQISMGIRPVWAESSLSAWRNIGFSATHHCEDSVFAGRTCHFVSFVMRWLELLFFVFRTLSVLLFSCKIVNAFVSPSFMFVCQVGEVYSNSYFRVSPHVTDHALTCALTFTCAWVGESYKHISQVHMARVFLFHNAMYMYHENVLWLSHMGRAKPIWYLSPMRAAKI